MNDMNWNLLRFALMTYRKGSASGAAESLAVTHATVIRGLKRLEQETGVKLFNKSHSGYTATEAGLQLIQMADEVESKIYDWNLDIESSKPELSGKLRVATTEIIAYAVLCPKLNDFYRLYPKIQLDISSSYDFCNLTRYELDLAIRSTMAPPEHLIGRKIATISWAIYQAHEINETSDYWVGCIDSTLPPAKWLIEIPPKAKSRYQASSLQTQLEATKVVLGKAVLPCFLADKEPSLNKLETLEEKHHTQLWLLYNKESRDNPRVKAFVSWINQHFDGSKI